MLEQAHVPWKFSFIHLLLKPRSGWFCPNKNHKHQVDCTPSLLLRSIAGFRPATRHRLSRHPPPWRHVCVRTHYWFLLSLYYPPPTSQTQIIGDKTKLQTFQENPKSNIISKNCPFATQNSQSFSCFSRLKVFTLAPAPVRKRRSSLAPGILEGGLCKS